MLDNKYIVVLGVLFFCFITACSSQTEQRSVEANSPVITIAIDGGYPPFSMKQDDGSVIGLDIDLANAVCQKAKLKCELKPTPWHDMIPLLEQGRIDAIVASLSPTEERKKRIDFTSSYMSVPPRYIGKASDVDGFDINSLANKRIGVEGSTSLDGYVSEAFPSAEFKRVHSVKDLIALLTTGEVDYIFTNGLVASYAFLKKPEGKGYSFVGPEAKSKKWFGDGPGIAINKNAGELKAKLNKAISEIRKDGTYESIVEKYL